VPVCAQCGEEVAEAKFCGNCGAPLVSVSAAREQRKTVTLLFCDVTGSTALGERLDPETLRRVMRRYFDEMRGVIERHGGTVEKFIGDAVMAVFGVPRVHEDDALRAVRAAVEIRGRLPAVAQELGIELVFRTGVNTGAVVVGDDETLATGDAVNVAARLEQAAAPGEILIGAGTRRLVRDAVVTEPLEPLALKGKAEPVEAFRLLDVDPSAPGYARRLDSPFVGRERELMHLRAARDRAVDERGCHLFTLLGPAGVGKSRLAAEVLGGLAGEATIVRGRCLDYGEGITFFALVEILMQLGDRAASVLEQVTEGGSTSPAELFVAVRRVFEEVARERPLVVVFDDLQRAEPMLLDLLDHVADLSRGAPILLLCLGRPELLEERPGWGGGKLNATTVLLEPLDAGACEQLLDHLGEGLDPAARARVVEASEGNPLFVEEMAALAREVGAVGVPGTIQAVLAARLERLDDHQRAVIERGAVEGKVFHSGAVRELGAEAERPELQAHLAALVRKELIRPDEALVAGEEAYRFRHQLIRDAAYDALPKQLRAELHVRFADWLEARAQELVELDEIAGWHLGQAIRYRRELGLGVDAVLAARAGRHLAAAGRGALARLDLRAAGTLLEQALELLPAGDDGRPEIALGLAETAVYAGRLERAEELLAEAAAAERTRSRATLLQLDVLLHARPQEVAAYAVTELPAVLERYEAAGDERGMARAHLAFARVHQLAGRMGPRLVEAERAAQHARRAGDRATLTEALASASAAVSMIADPVTARAKLAEYAAAAPEHAAFVDFGLAMIRADLALGARRFDEARAQQRRCEEILDELGMDMRRWTMARFGGEVELAAGDAAAAIAQLRRACDELAKLGEHSYRSGCAVILAKALYEDGRPEEAEREAIAAEREGATVDVINFAAGRSVLARIHTDRGQLERAEEVARSAVAYAFETDIPRVRGDALSALGQVLVAAGRPPEAAQAFQDALALYEHKGDLTEVAATRARLDDLQGAAPTTSPSA
jgi:class 3 adenylate cyclase/predicted ATPase